MTENVSQSGMEPYKNPDCLPLEELHLEVNTGGVVQVVEALSERWADDRYFLCYEIPDIYKEDGTEIIGAKARWIEIVNYINNDLKWLLRLPFYRFWSNIVFNSSILDTITSFLQEAPPFYALENFPNVREMHTLFEDLRRNVLVLFARLVQHKESPEQYMSPQFLGDLLYKHYIFTVPIIFDLCQLYGRDNADAIQKILYRLFQLQALYNDDLQKSVDYLIEALRNVEWRFEDRPKNEIDGAVSLSQRGGAAIEITLQALEGLLIYVLDISSTVSVFLKVYPPAVDIFHNEAFVTKIVSIYENTISEMYKRLDQLAYNDESMPKYIELKHRLDCTRVEILSLYRRIISHPLRVIETSLEILPDDIRREHVEDYVNILTNAISEKEFITDYHQYYPIESDLEYLSSVCPEFAVEKFDYILRSIYATIGQSNTSTGRSPKNASSHNEVRAGPSRVQHDRSVASTSKDTTVLSESKSSPVPNSVETTVLVSKLKDIFPKFGDGFIQMCLKHYNYDSEAVIDAILRERLPPDLKELDSTLPNIPPDPMEASAAMDLVMGAQRLNVFDNDEFDIMTQDKIDMSRVHRGKRRDKYKDANDMLNDKSFIREAGDIYNKYRNVIDEYDDEYDDTYDDRDVSGIAQDDSAKMEAPPFTTPRVLMKNMNKTAATVESEPDDDDSTNEQNGGDNFIQNPEKLRALADERRQNAQRRKNYNVVGKPKGQGQDKDVLISRDRKNTHKATQANHNRRSGAQRKRNQGMIPS